ncbi:OmpA family protein [Epibacterium ulvae]|jgi:chemotaxis protein MotB|uniref:OmpA family protein n=1 Tax=Epibacterium ulvae TaxID=1156985 RepID=UPI002490969D|nr:OmpA family protein [Epibacterium ulvae]
MRRLERNRARAEEEESVFVTMTDMTISFLLIIMILLAFFATQLNDDETVPLTAYERVRQERDDLRVENQSLRSSVEALEAELARVTSDLETVTAERDRLRSELDQLRDENEALRTRVVELEEENEQLRSRIDQLVEEIEQLREEIERLQVVNPLEAYLSQAIDQRREILVELRDRLLIEFPELQVVISPEQDALRFQGEGLFRSGSSQLEPRQHAIVETMGRLLDEILVCFTLGERAERGPNCESGNALIEAVQIEGHTDSDGSDLSNLRLSTDRANATLLVMLSGDQAILAHQNLRGQPVMSVSGYGEMRPIETNETTEGKAANRRIDLRIIMYAPSTVEEVEAVGRRLDALRAAGGAE